MFYFCAFLPLASCKSSTGVVKLSFASAVNRLLSGRLPSCPAPQQSRLRQCWGDHPKKSDAVCIDLVWVKHVQGSGECKPQSGGQGSPQRAHDARQCAGQLQLVGGAAGVGSVSARPTCALWANPVNDDPQGGGQWLPTCCRRRTRRRALRASRPSKSDQPSSYDSAPSA